MDVTVPVHPELTPLWPGSPEIGFERRLSLGRGDAANDTTLTLSAHTGTHVDAPAHHIVNGTTVEELPLSLMIGCCRVVDLRGLETVDRSALSRRENEISKRTLLRTDNSGRWSNEFHADFTGLAVEAARWIVERGVRLLGIDYLSVQPFGESDDVHRCLLEADVIVLEGLDLSDIAPGEYEMICLPMNLIGVEAAPARVLLRPLEERRFRKGSP